ncbi:hypothetical protein [Acinetobacter phage vB_AbaP_HB01]|nr:hypothetical protein [Acinetobacter phage vB_AbaP_HB01]
MDKYYLGRKASIMCIDECTRLGDSLREIAEKISAESVPKVPVIWLDECRYFLREIAEKISAESVPKVPVIWLDECKYFKERQVESNDWRRKSKRGFNGYRSHV